LNCFDFEQNEVCQRHIDFLDAVVMQEPFTFPETRYFDLSLDMLCVAHFNGHFLMLSSAWERTLGFTREELQSQPLFEFVHPDDRERTREQNRIVRSGGRALGFENRYRCRDGSYRWFHWNAIADMDHQLIYSVARDVTETKQAEEERERLVRELQAALKEVRELRGILPICAYCKSIRNDENYWQTLEGYLAKHTNAQFTHGVCPTCYNKLLKPQLDQAGKS
jgi:PAS domain S-box-containing protein